MSAQWNLRHVDGELSNAKARQEECQTKNEINKSD